MSPGSAVALNFAGTATQIFWETVKVLLPPYLPAQGISPPSATGSLQQAAVVPKVLAWDVTVMWMHTDKD